MAGLFVVRSDALLILRPIFQENHITVGIEAGCYEPMDHYEIIRPDLLASVFLAAFVSLWAVTRQSASQ